MKILVVDDHALVREGLCQVLKGLDPGESTEVLQAPDCAQAFALAQAHPDLDLVLLDYHLPDMNGLAALAIFGKKHPELPGGDFVRLGQPQHHAAGAGARRRRIRHQIRLERRTAARLAPCARR